ncbi:MAG: hypothetical protein ACJAWM_001470 [Sulfitobacter sp.]|jgi:hypothetical protein|uniref:hypothetical protein n=2 Tax=Sulfitobacter sp. TaxID=1903071 RepID=UPI0039E34A39
MYIANQSSKKQAADQLPPITQRQPNSTVHGLIAIGVEFVMLAVLIALVPVIVYIDVTILSDRMSEESLTEFLHNALLFVSIAFVVTGAFKYALARGYLLLVATFFLCLFIRECDALFDNIWQGFWIIPALSVLTVGIALVYRNRGTLTEPLLRHFETRPATFIYIGVLLLLIFTRLFGTGSLWEAVMGSSYSSSYKTAIQEGLELMSYTLIAYGSFISYIGRFGLSHSQKSRIDASQDV